MSQDASPDSASGDRFGLPSASPQTVDTHRFTRELHNLLRTEIDGLSTAEKAALVRRHVELFERDRALVDLRLDVVPFVPGRRPVDELHSPGLGSSEPVGLLNAADSDRMLILYRLIGGGGAALADMPAGSRLLGTIHHVDHRGRLTTTIPGWNRREIQPVRMSDAVGRDTAHTESDLPEAWLLELDVDSRFSALGADGQPSASSPFGFGSLFFERFRLKLELEIEDVAVTGDTFDFEIYDEAKFGTLYARIAQRLLPRDIERQATAFNEGRLLPVSYHPWFPVLCIGVEKANLYMKAIRGDITKQKRMLTDPGWLLRVGLYLELLTCLGIIEAVRDDGDLLTAEERDLFENSPQFSEIRKRIDRTAWRRVWELRQVAFGHTPGFGEMPVAFTNLLRKREATLEFLHAHHDDLRHAIDLAGANVVNSQETWHRVFRDAERAVLKMNEEAFPELGFLGDQLRNVVLWHRRGALAGLQILPAFVSGAFGDQDGLFASACRQYRDSMNHVAIWAAGRGLMEFSGTECIPESVSLLETHVAGNRQRFQHLQERDGYQDMLAVRDRESVEIGPDVDAIASAIEKISLFRVLTHDEIVGVASRARAIHLGPQERIIVQGRKGSSLFVIYDGELEVLAKHNGRDRVIAQLGRGAVVGEMSFLTGQARTASVRAIESAIVIEISASLFRPVVRDRPAILEELTDLMSKRTESERHSRKSLRSKVSAAIFAPSFDEYVPSANPHAAV